MWHFVYILQNEHSRHYVGLTDDVEDRLVRHNRGEIPSTAKYKPWHILHFAAFPTREKAASYDRQGKHRFPRAVKLPKRSGVASFSHVRKVS